MNGGPFTTIALEGGLAASPDPEVFDAAGGATTYIAFSRDLGTTWSVTPRDSLLDEPFKYVNRLVVTNDAVVAEVSLNDSTADRPLRNVLRGRL